MKMNDVYQAPRESYGHHATLRFRMTHAPLLTEVPQHLKKNRSKTPEVRVIDELCSYWFDETDVEIEFLRHQARRFRAFALSSPTPDFGRPLKSRALPGSEIHLEPSVRR